MKIAGGTFRGRPLAVPRGDEVRPTQDRVREALFNMLQGVVAGAQFLDLFAGSGAVGLEALSRGAAGVTFVEAAPRHLACLARNVASLGVGAQARCVHADVYAWLDRPSPAPFDIVFADPPYALGVARTYAGVLTALAARGYVAPGGLFVAEMTRTQQPDVAPAWEVCRDRVYGQTRLVVYRRREQTAG